MMEMSDPSWERFPWLPFWKQSLEAMWQKNMEISPFMGMYSFQN